MLSLINAFFSFDGMDEIVDLTPQSESLPAFLSTTESRGCRIDILAKSREGKYLNVEVQRSSQEFFFKRSFFHVSRIYGGQIAKNESYTKLKQTITINILDYVLGIFIVR